MYMPVSKMRIESDDEGDSSDEEPQEQAGKWKGSGDKGKKNNNKGVPMSKKVGKKKR